MGDHLLVAQVLWELGQQAVHRGHVTVQFQDLRLTAQDDLRVYRRGELVGRGKRGVAYSSRHIERHEGMRGHESISESVRLLRSVDNMTKPCNQPAQAEVVLTLRSTECK